MTTRNAFGSEGQNGNYRDIEDREGALLLPAEIIYRFSWLRHLFADDGYSGEQLREALRRIDKWTVDFTVSSLAWACRDVRR